MAAGETRQQMFEDLVVPGDLASLEAIGKHVTAVAAEAGLDRRAAYRLRLAVDEVATNSITHGYQEHGQAGDVVVKAALDDSTLVVTVEDSAPAFDPREREGAEEETLDLPLDQRQVGGLGVFLAVRGVDEFRYEYRGNRNRNIFVVKRPAAPA